MSGHTHHAAHVALMSQPTCLSYSRASERGRATTYLLRRAGSDSGLSGRWVPHDGAARKLQPHRSAAFSVRQCIMFISPSVSRIHHRNRGKKLRTHVFVHPPAPSRRSRATQLSMSITALPSLKHLLDRSTPVVDRPSSDNQVPLCSLPPRAHSNPFIRGTLRAHPASSIQHPASSIFPGSLCPSPLRSERAYYAWWL